jgi:hypothetical protein
VLTPDERDQIVAIRRRLNGRLDAIAADATLSPHGRRVRRAREQLAAEAAVRGIGEASDARHIREQQDRYYKAFGMKSTSAGAIRADRDARDWAAQFTSPADALRALAQAELDGDTGRARALAARAWSQRGEADMGGHWEQVVRCYAEGDPARDRDLGALAEVEPGKTDRLRDNLYRNFTRPPDLQQGGIEALAAETPEPVEA